MALALPGQWRAGEVDGELATCRLCGRRIAWEFDDPDPRSDNPFGLWRDEEHGWDVCPASSEDNDDYFHEPAPADDTDEEDND